MRLSLAFALFVSLLPSGVAHSGASGHPHGATSRVVVRVGRAGATTVRTAPIAVPAGGILRVDGTLVIRRTSLAIGAGARVESAPGVSIIIDRDATLDVRGTVLEPVLFTCPDGGSAPGCWAGLVILGNATLNHGTLNSPASPRSTGGCRQSTFDGTPYGGCADDDSSGVLLYARVQYATFGLQLRGVGRRTVIENLQVHRSAGSGIEVVGGTASFKRVALTTNAQYGLAWAGGWRGQAQFLVIQQDPSGFAGGIRGRNGLQPSGDHDALPRSSPTLTNITVVTRGGAANPFANSPPRTIVLERGTAGRLQNLLLVEPSLALDVDDAATCSQVLASQLTLAGVFVILPGLTTDPDVDVAGCTGQSGDERLLADASPTVVTDPSVGGRQLTSALDLLLPDLRPLPGTLAFTTVGQPAPADPFFERSGFIGALRPFADRTDVPFYSGWSIGEILPPPGPAIVRGVALGVGRGGVEGAVVTALPSGVAATTDAAGGFELVNVPAGPVELVLSNVSGCGAGGSLVTAHVGVPVAAAVLADCSVADAPRVSLDVGSAHACALRAVAAVVCWGSNASGQLGDSTTIDRSSPVEVPGGITGRRAVASGGSHSCAVDAPTIATCWGLNILGQIGDGSSTSPRLVPRSVAGNWVMLTGGASHTCGLDATGIASCWGSNSNGQLGDGGVVLRRAPAPVSTTVRFAWIDAGDAHTCGIATDGLLWCWGNNAFGQLGDASTVQRLTPVRVADASLYGRLSAGGLHTCAADYAGTARCWGANADGQVGDGTQVGRIAPASVADPASRFVGVSAGFRHTCGVTSSGLAKCWGAATSGRLGNGGLTTQLSPVSVAGATDYLRIGAGASFSCGLATNGEVRCWGANSSGQVGDGTNTDRLVPTVVSGGLLFLLPN